jgi:hypothetical protein
VVARSHGDLWIVNGMQSDSALRKETWPLYPVTRQSLV